MGFFNIFKSRESKQIEKIQVRMDVLPQEEPSEIEVARSYNKHLLSEGISLGSVVLLWWCDGKSIEAYIPRYFLYDYSINANIEFIKLFDKGFLRWSTPKEHLESLKVIELKNILEKYGLPVSGRKKIELIDRIKANLTDEDLATNINGKVYKVTELGNSILRKYSNIIWGHKNNSKDGSVNAFTFENKLTGTPESYAIEILENAFILDIKNRDFGMSTIRLKNISNYRGGDIDALMQSFCIEISGLNNSGRYLWVPEYYPHLGKSLKAEIVRNDLNDIEIEDRLKTAWEICYKLFPMSIVNTKQDALDLLFLALNEDKEKFDLLIKKLYKKAPDKYKLNY